jgi:D-alanyl-lipoteichoic acid acyltransferase DltB (MBOAT superfamily)
MLFNSLDFAIFLPIVFGLFWTLGRYGSNVQNWILLVASYIFYGFWDWRFLGLLAFSSAFDYFVGAELHRQTDKHKRKTFFWASVAVNLTLLGFFKYYNFFADSFVNAFSFFGQKVSLGSLEVLLPVGISFYTFQSMSYAFDIYRRELEPVKSIVPFMTFVAFFPHMVAGPIQRASFFLPQFLTHKKFDYALASKGLKIMLFGFFMKVAIADRLALYVDAVYGNVDMHTGWSYMLATFFFAFQIYGDFAGYSLIAIGCAWLFGFHMSPNFNRPYFSGSFREFWSRWHISLSTWFKDYLYIPLGGNRGSKARTYGNLFTTFLVSGLWHGANWTFVIWGALHGGYQIVERKLAELLKIKLPKILSIPLVFALTCLAWVFFRAANVQDAFQVIGGMFTNLGSSIHVGDIGILTFSVMGVLMLIMIEIMHEYYPNVTLLNHRSAPVRYATITAMLVFIISFGVFDGSQFIYFQF